MLSNNRRRVAHVVRKMLPRFSSFIRNQVMNHLRYDAIMIYKEFIESAFAHEIMDMIPSFYCNERKMGIGKLYSDFLYRRPFRRLTNIDVSNVTRYLRIHNVNIIHYHYGTDAGVFVRAIASTKIPALVSFYGYDCSSFPDWYLGLGKFYLRRVFKNVDYCIAMSEDMKSDLLRLGCPEGKIIVHYYGTDVQRFLGEKTYDEKGEIILLSVGYLVPQKGHAFTLGAFRKALRMTNKKMRLRIVGEGRLEPSLKKYVARHGLSDCVDFVGPLKHLSREFLEEFSRADVFIHPSVTSNTNEKEGIPGAIVEAMASGLPVISTFHAGIPFVIHNGETGLLVHEWDTAMLAKFIVKLAEDAGFRKTIGRRAQEYALKNLDVKQKQKELENIYDLVIEEHNKRYGNT